MNRSNIQGSLELQNDNPEPHERQSIKGLFTFYREQDEMEQSLKQLHMEEKMKLIKEKIKNKLKLREQNQIKSHSRAEKKLKKSRSKTNLTLPDDHKEKIKRKKKAKKTIKQPTKSEIALEEPGLINKTIAVVEEEDPAQKFLKRVRHRKTKSPSPQLENQQQKLEEAPQKEKFNQLFYPKQSLSNQNIVDSLVIKAEQENKFLNMKSGKGKKQVIIVDEFLLRRSSSEVRKSLNSRKRLYTELEEGSTSKPLIGNNVKQNFYSHPKLKQIIQMANKLEKRPQVDPISPPSELQNQEMKAVHKPKQETGNYESIKLPEIKNTRLSRELRKVEQAAADQLQRYGSNKSKKSVKKLNKSGLREGRRIIEYSPKQKIALRKKLQTEPQTCCVAMIDLSRSTNNESQLKNNSWTSKKKLLFKKLGINI